MFFRHHRMAIEVLSSEISSPRVSFSHDLDQTDGVDSIEEYHHHQRLDTSLLNSTSDSDFCFVNSFVQELPSADELFSNGKILPIEIKKKHVPKQVHRRPDPTRTTTTTTDNTGKKRLKEFLSMSIDADDKPATKSFWQFKRSSSLNCDSTRSKSLIRSLQFLTRSNSTGSTPVPKQPHKQNLQKQPSLSRKSSSSSSSLGGFYYTYGNVTQRPPLKKSCSGKHGNGVRVSPVLNLPHPIISNASVRFFGIGSLFCKKKKR